MAYPPTPTLTAVQTPTPKAFIGVHDPATDGTLTSLARSDGQQLYGDELNARAARGDVGDRIGGGIWGVVPGSAGMDCNLSTTSGLTLNIAEGLIQMDGPVYIAAQSVVVTDTISRVYLYINQAGAPVQVNASLTPPAGAHVFLGSCVTNSPAGSITGIDFSGVVYLNGPVAHRFSNDASTPGDVASLPANISFVHHGTADLWLYDGDAYWHLSGGSGGTLPIADGGTGATTAPAALVNLGAAPRSLLTINPANGTNTVSATDSLNSAIVLTGGTASSQFTLELTVAGSPTVPSGHVWEIENRTSFGVLIRRAGSGVGNVFLGQGSANDQRGDFLWNGNEIRRIARATAYVSRVITATLTATQGQVEADFNVTGAQTGVQLLALPAVAGLEGQVVAHQADLANYPLVVEANGETEPGASMTLLPGEVWQVVQDAAGRYWPIGRQEREVIIDFALDANLTLDASEALARTLILQDTTVVLTVSRDVIWDVTQSVAGKVWHVENQTLKAIVFKTSGGAGVTVATGMAATIRIDSGLDMKRCTPDVAP